MADKIFSIAIISNAVCKNFGIPDIRLTMKAINDSQNEISSN